jgi:RNA polymerase sigma-70 factor (sigma-E family)
MPYLRHLPPPPGEDTAPFPQTPREPSLGLTRLEGCQPECKLKSWGTRPAGGIRVEMTADRARTTALAGLYALHAPKAGRLAYLLTGNRELAEDLVQDAFVRVAGRFGGLRSPESFEAYLRKTIVNLSRGHWRRQSTERRYLRSHGRRGALTSDEIPDVASHRAIVQALASLTDRQRAAIVLRYYEDLTEQQTADVIGCSLGTVKSLVSRGMTTLRAEIKSEDHR